jgi:hypothetical protein
MGIIMRHQDAQSLAEKIIGDFVKLLIAGQVKFAMGSDGFIDRVREAVS